MIEKLQPVYRCEHCKKYSVYKHIISRHEKFCKKNPANEHACFHYCKHLKKEAHTDTGEYGEEYIHGYDFSCSKQEDKLLYSYKAERKKMKRSDGSMIEGERMPAKCDLFEIMEGHEDYLEMKK